MFHFSTPFFRKKAGEGPAGSPASSRLQEAVDGFLREHGLDGDALVYRWNGKGEEETDREFAEFHRRLEAAVREKRTDLIRDLVVEIVSVWGGIAAGRRLVREYPPMLLSLDEDEPIGDETRLATWTKVLAAYRPGKFCIYDSRVAVALRVLFPEKRWFLPAPRENRSALCGYLGTDGQMTPRESYAEYMRLLNATGEPVRYERMLFMLGGLLAYSASEGIVIQSRR